MLATEAQIKTLTDRIAQRATLIALPHADDEARHAEAEALSEDAQLLRTVSDPCGDPNPAHVEKLIARRAIPAA